MSVASPDSSSFVVDGVEVGDPHRTWFVAEIGNNHNGDLRLATRLVEQAAKAGAGAVKIQKRDLSSLQTAAMAGEPNHRFPTLGSTYGEYRRSLELGVEELRELRDHAAGLGLTFFGTPFDIPSADALAELDVALMKIASFDVTNLPLIRHVATMGLPVFLATGMSTLDEIDAAVEALLRHESRVVVLHCVSLYPTPDEHCNLRMIDTLRARYHPLPIGYSGHERSILPSVLAAARGACVIERHLTLDKDLPGTDHGTVSLVPEEFAEMVTTIRRAESMLGDGRKRVLDAEWPTRRRHAKSLVMRVSVPAGTRLESDMVVCKCPGEGLPPSALPDLVGRRVVCNLDADTPIRPQHLE